MTRCPERFRRCGKSGRTPTSLPGAVVAQYRNVGGKTYGPYWSRMWREDGRLRKAYVPRGELESVRRACENWAERKALGNRESTRRLLASWRAVGRLLDRADDVGWDRVEIRPREVRGCAALAEINARRARLEARTEAGRPGRRSTSPGEGGGA